MLRAVLPVALFIAILASCGRVAPPAAPPPATPELWYWHHSLLNSAAAVRSSAALIDQARAAGYTGVAFWDVSFIYLNSTAWPPDAGEYLRQAMAYAQSQGMKVLAQGAPFGYSNDVLNTNPNWAEGQRVIGSRFVVDSNGVQLRPINSFSGIANGGFEAGESDWFARHDRGVEVDPLVSHSGIVSGAIRNAPGNGRFFQALNLTPWRQYHVRLWAKTSGYRGPVPALEVFDARHQEENRVYKYLNTQPSQDWTQFDATFNSQESTRAYLYFGVWGGNSGTIWFDDVSVEETALVYLIRRPGAPLRIYDPNTGGSFDEGKDVDPVRDRKLTADPHDDYHDPPTVTLPAGTRLKPGQTVAIDYYAAQPVYSHQLGLCLTEPEVQAWLTANAQKVAATVPDGAGFFLQYDEMRQMNSCALCRSKKMTPGELLAWHADKTIELYRSLRPAAPIYVWSDMFDPYANAHDHYLLVEGNVAGSWRGLRGNVIVMNWNLDHLRDSLQWFSGQSRRQPVAHRQIIAGYYDNHDGDAAATSELNQARGIPGIDGLMYTTWVQDVSQLQRFADAAKRHWAQYRASVMRHL